MQTRRQKLDCKERGQPSNAQQLPDQKKKKRTNDQKSHTPVSESRPPNPPTPDSQLPLSAGATRFDEPTKLGSTSPSGGKDRKRKSADDANVSRPPQRQRISAVMIPPPHEILGNRRLFRRGLGNTRLGLRRSARLESKSISGFNVSASSSSTWSMPQATAQTAPKKSLWSIAFPAIPTKAVAVTNPMERQPHLSTHSLTPPTHESVRVPGFVPAEPIKPAFAAEDTASQEAQTLEGFPQEVEINNMLIKKGKYLSLAVSKTNLASHTHGTDVQGRLGGEDDKSENILRLNKIHRSGRGVNSGSQMFEDSDRAQLYTKTYCRSNSGYNGKVLCELTPDEESRRAGGEMKGEECDQEQQPRVTSVFNLTGAFRVPSPSDSESSTPRLTGTFRVPSPSESEGSSPNLTARSRLPSPSDTEVLGQAGLGSDIKETSGMELGGRQEDADKNFAAEIQGSTKQGGASSVEGAQRDLELRFGQEEVLVLVGDTSDPASETDTIATVMSSAKPSKVCMPTGEYFTFSPRVQAYLDSMWTQADEQAAVKGFAQGFAKFIANGAQQETNALENYFL